MTLEATLESNVPVPTWGRSAWALALAGVLVVLVSATLVTLADRSALEHERRASRSAAVIAAQLRVEKLLLDVETGQRGYLLTASSAFRESYDSAIRELPAALAQLDRLAGDDPSQQKASGRVRALAEAKADHSGRAVTLFASGARDQARNLVLGGRGLDIMEQLRSVVADAQVDERRQVTASARAARAASSRANTVSAGAAVALLLLLATMLHLIGRHARSERRRICAETARMGLAAELALQSGHDPMTGLPNRRLLEDRIEQAVARTSMDGTLLALLYIDLDRFKLVNDRHGHTAGDHALTTLAGRLRSVLGTTDTLARVGGEEFVALCEGLPDRDAAMSVVESVHAQVADLIQVGPSRIELRASVGVATADHTGIRVEDDHHEGTMVDPAVDAESLIAAAEEAMYRAKQLGRAPHQLYSIEVAQRRLQKTALVNDLREALAGNTAAGGWLWVAYQPLVDLPGGEPIGVEALARWTHPQLGEVSPGQFIPLAEESGLITPLGEFVTDTACAQAVAWNARRAAHGLEPLYMSVNCSARQLLDPQSVDRLADTLERHGLSPHDLVLELTESVLVDSISGAEDCLQRIADTGVRLALDDFGTGYSSLAYLRRFPFQLVKIDRSFASGLGRNADDEAIVSAVAAMASGLGLSVIIEGIETADQARHAARLGCHLAQGYHFARPGAPESIHVMLLGSAAHAGTSTLTTTG